MIKLNNVSKSYSNNSNDSINNFNISNLSLEIEQNDFFGIVGKSGAGKSTILNIIGNIETIDSGSIIINDINTMMLNKKELRNLRKSIGYVFQDPNLLRNLNIIDNISLPLKLLKIKKSERYEKSIEILEIIGLSDLANKYPHELSGGEKQRISIARALINNPKILLCDEITSALDIETSYEILNLLIKLKEKYNLTIVFVSHELDLVKKVCNKVAIIKEGQINKIVALNISNSHNLIKDFDYIDYLKSEDQNNV